MSLEAGTYFIKNGDKFIGLAGGKRVVLLDEGVEAPKVIYLFSQDALLSLIVSSRIQWKVDKKGRAYILKVEGYATTNANNLIWATEEEPEQWLIVNSERNGKESFIIKSQYSPEGWVAPFEDEGPQIMYRILIVGPSIPPYYPPNEVFEFIRVDRD
ncbi:hypothetical protein VNI00_006901 [Paramarasmius palmivorus]|uniref:Uncharacterized protein n=1 Tax=Paramarasmius palmivorus TaxID=297713 RepID=A0AAW0D906_9AGAR